MKLLSIVVPCYKEEEALPLFYSEVHKVLNTIDIDHEIIFVDDGSTDRTLNVMHELSGMDPKVHYISFSRNFGKEAAMYAGLANAKGEYVAVMDADLQDPPELLPKMLEILESEEYDSVATRRVSRRGEPVLRSFFARTFYRIINKISDADIVDGARDFRLMKRKMIDAVVAMTEYNRFSKGIFGWIGFKTYWVPFENVERVAGETKWSFWKLTRYAVDGIFNFSQIPLKISSWTGLFMTFVSLLWLIYIVVKRTLFGNPVAGWASTACIIIFVGGIQLFCMGIMGQYIARIYMETKNRPHFIIADTDIKEAVVIK